MRGLHGLDGRVRIEVLTDRPEVRLAPGATLFVEGEPAPLTVAAASPVADGPGWWLTLAEVPSRSAAERLRGRYLEAEADPAADLAPGQAFWHEVIGVEVVGSTGRSLGRVVDVYRAGETEVYVVRGPAGELDVPAVRAVVTEFEPAAGRIVVDEAALAVDEPPVDERPGGASAASAPAAGQPAAGERRRARWSRHGAAGRSADGPGPTGTAR